MDERNGDDEDAPKQDDSYCARSSGYISEYRGAYSEWMASLSPEERERVKKMGLGSPLIDYHASESSADISDRRLPPVIEASDDLPQVQRCIWEVVDRIVILLIDAPNIRLEADTLACVAGFHARMGRSGTELGARYGLHRATWSKRCKQLQRMLGLPPSRAMKSEEACRKYALTNGAMKSKR